MAWQRKIPFGYSMENGRMTIQPQEAQAVKDIFAAYLSGESYQKIAARLTQTGPRYHSHTEVWNKNMVKRILENEVYLGGNNYPQLITKDELLAVRLKRGERTIYAPCPAAIQPIRQKALCAQCGARMTRDTKTHSKPHWVCTNDDCKQAIYIADEFLLDMVNAQLWELAENPQLLALPEPEYTPSADARRLEREVTLSLNRGESGEVVKAMVLALASETYACLPDPTPAHRMETLRQKVQTRPVSQQLLDELLETAVKEIYLDQETVRLELINGELVEEKREGVPA